MFKVHLLREALATADGAHPDARWHTADGCRLTMKLFLVYVACVAAGESLAALVTDGRIRSKVCTPSVTSQRRRAAKFALTLRTLMHLVGMHIALVTHQLATALIRVGALTALEDVWLVV